MYNEYDPNIEHIRAVAEDIAARISREYGIPVYAKTEEDYCWIELPCADRMLVSVTEIDSGSAPLSAFVFCGDGMERFFTRDYKTEDEFAQAVFEYVRGFFGRQIRMTRKTKFLGGISTKAEYLLDGEWQPFFEKNDSSFFIRFVCWSNKALVTEYDFRIK